MAEKKTTKKKAVATKAKDTAELLAEKRADLLQSLRSHKAGELVNPKVLRSLRKEIAQLMTKMNAEKQERKGN